MKHARTETHDGKASDADIAGEGRPVVLFDGGCPLCRREIDHYRRLPGASALHWVDILGTSDLEPRFGVNAEQAMGRMHVRDADGTWRTGAAAFVVMWEALPRYRWLARLVALPPILWLAERVYRVFAARRFRSRCRDGCLVAD